MVADQRPMSGSVAASGYFKEKWFKTKEQRESASRALGRARSLGVALAPNGSAIVRYNKNAPEYVAGLVTFDPWEMLALRRPDLTATVERVGHSGVLFAKEAHIVPRLGTIVAAGAWTDELMARSGLAKVGVQALQGSGLIFGNTPPPDVPLWQEVSPYRQYAIRRWANGTVRVCATLETKPEKHEEYLAKMEDATQRHLSPERQRLEVLCGLRPVLEEGPTARKVTDKVVVATGGGRIGAIYSFAVAEKACDLLGVR